MKNFKKSLNKFFKKNKTLKVALLGLIVLAALSSLAVPTLNLFKGYTIQVPVYNPASSSNYTYDQDYYVVPDIIYYTTASYNQSQEVLTLGLNNSSQVTSTQYEILIPNNTRLLLNGTPITRNISTSNTDTFPTGTYTIKTTINGQRLLPQKSFTLTRTNPIDVPCGTGLPNAPACPDNETPNNQAKTDCEASNGIWNTATATCQPNLTPDFCIDNGGSYSYDTNKCTYPNTSNTTAQINFRENKSTTSERDRTLNLTVTLSTALEYTLRVPYTLQSSSTATINKDFNLESNRWLTFEEGDKSQTIEVEILDDDTREFDETIVLKLNSYNTNNNVTVGSRNIHTLTIEDNDGGMTRNPINPNNQVSCEKYFIDVDRYHPLCDEVSYLRQAGVFMGQDTNRGRVANLNAELKRSEYFAIATRLLRRENYRVGNLNNLLKFKDLTPSEINNPNNQWWLTSVAQLDGIVRGYGDGTLQAGRVTTEAEIAKVALEGTFRNFSNRDYMTPWFVDTLQFMDQYRYYIDANRNATRGDAIEILYVIIQIEKDQNFYSNNFY